MFCEGVDLTAAAASFGTPTYLYSRAGITDAYGQFETGLNKIPHTICFAVKSNGNLSLLNHLAKMGSGFDIVSGGEMPALPRTSGDSWRPDCIFWRWQDAL